MHVLISPPERFRMGLRRYAAPNPIGLALRLHPEAQSGLSIVKCFRFFLTLFSFISVGFLLQSQAQADFLYNFAPQSSFQLINTAADGSVVTQSNGFVLTGGNTGSGLPGSTDYVATATQGGVVNFTWLYASADQPTFDFSGYLLNSNFFPLADTNGESGIGGFSIQTGDQYGFRVGTADNTGERGILTVTSAPMTTAPEPGTAAMLLTGIGLTFLIRRRLTEVNR